MSVVCFADISTEIFLPRAISTLCPTTSVIKSESSPSLCASDLGYFSANTPGKYKENGRKREEKRKKKDEQRKRDADEMQNWQQLKKDDGELRDQLECDIEWLTK